jgi:hypothetical protein
MTKDEALNLALEALEVNNQAWKSLADSGDAGFWEAEEQPFYELSVKAITALKQTRALDKKAENARELGLDYEPALKDNSNYRYDPPFAEPDYKALWQQMCERCDELDKELSATDRQVEILSDALAESRREVAAPVQEPVAWMFQHEETGRTMCVDAQQIEWGFEKGNPRLKKIEPLYTTPPAAQRQWAGLTDEEIYDLSREMVKGKKSVNWLSYSIEAKLKERNV